MSPNTFINCCSYNVIFTGSSGNLLGTYDLNSGSGTALIYNLIYPTGYHFSGGLPFSPSVPILSVGAKDINNYKFSGVNSYRLGYQSSGDFGIILDVDYSGCLRSTTGISYVLFSTQQNPTGTGTFFLEVNDYNRLSFRSSGFNKTLGYELKDKNIIFVGLGNQQYVNFGVYDLLNNEVVSESILLDNKQKTINELYIGGFLNNTNPNYTGYFGKINNIVYSDGPLVSKDIISCSDCLFATGQTTGQAEITYVSVPTITGYLLSGVSGQVITGFVSYTGSIQKFDSSLITLNFLSGVSQTQRIEEISTLLTGSVLVGVTGKTPLIFYKDNSKLTGFMKYDIELDKLLTSGDTVEIYTYPTFNSLVNKNIIDFNYPIENYVQLIGNGLTETKDVDYFVDRGLVSGFLEDDILIYDLLTGSGIISSFSGYWTEDKISMSGGGYYPSQSQFIEKSGLIIISGINERGIQSDNDVFMDGQKLTSGFHYYYSGVSGTNMAILDPSYIPRLIVYPIYPTTGGLPTGISDVEDAEITFLPNYGNFTKYLYNISVDTSILSGITGFSERVWVNGIRQRLNDDYLRNFSCTQNSGFNNPPDVPFVFFNGDTGYFNI